MVPLYLILQDVKSCKTNNRQMWISAQLVTHVEKGQESFSKDCSVWLRVQGILDSGHEVLVGGR